MARMTDVKMTIAERLLRLLDHLDIRARAFRGYAALYSRAFGCQAERRRVHHSGSLRGVCSGALAAVRRTTPRGIR